MPRKKRKKGFFREGLDNYEKIFENDNDSIFNSYSRFTDYKLKKKKKRFK